MKRIFLANDTSSGHCGSKAVMNSIYNSLSGHYIVGKHYVHVDTMADKTKELIDKSEIVIVNGEGTIHHRNRAGTTLMEILKYGQEQNKKTMLINTVFDNPTPYYNEVLQKLDYLSVREQLSYENAIKCGANPEILLDSCVDPINISNASTLIPDFRNKIVLGGAHPAVMCYNIFKTLDFPELSCQMRSPLSSFNTIIQSLKKAQLYITDQHHGLYAAGIAGIPFVVAPSNSHKIEGLIKWSGLPIKICNTRDEIMKQIRFATDIKNKHIYDDFHKFITSGNFLNKEKMEKILNEI